MNCFRDSSNSRQSCKFCDTVFIIIDMLEQLTRKPTTVEGFNQIFLFWDLQGIFSLEQDFQVCFRDHIGRWVLIA